MSGMLLRLAGPLQSWGERSPFTAERDTAPFPTRSAMIGMFAAAEGRTRDQDLDPYDQLEFTVRVDRRGQPMVDYHTVGGGEPDEFTAATSGGKHKGEAVITQRTYLADAVFVVAVTGAGSDIDRVARALHQPHWNPYLGRRSCPPDEPFLLRPHVEDPVAELRERVPLSPPRDHEPWQGSDATDPTVAVDFYWETYTGGPLPEDATTLSVPDVPVSFVHHHRSHTRRRLHRTTEHLPATLRADQRTLHQQLVHYAQGTEGDPA